MARVLNRLAFWLLPGPSQRRPWQQLIDELALEYGGPSFLPHVTLYACDRSVDDREIRILQGLGERHGSCLLDPVALATTDRFTQTLILRLTPSLCLSDLHNRIHQSVPKPSAYVLEPHLSLLYGDLGESVRHELVKSLRVSMAPVHFTELQLVAIPDRNESVDDVLSWQTLARCSLRS